MEAIQDLSMEVGEMQVIVSALRRVKERIREVSETHQPLFGGEHFLTSKEVCEQLYISPRTLQDYRDRKIIPYTQFAGKILYKAQISKGSWKRITEEAGRKSHICELKTALGSRGESAPSAIFYKAHLIQTETTYRI